jgi:hypothetical protein
MDQEEPDGSFFVPSGATPLGDQPGNSVVTELFEMKAIHALIWQLVPSRLCHPPFVSHPQSSALYALFGIRDEPKFPAFVAARGLDKLFPSFSTEKAGRLMDAALQDAERQGEGHQCSAVSTLSSSGPGAWLKSGKHFTSALLQVEGNRSDYYRTTPQGAEAAVSLQFLREDHQLQELGPGQTLDTAPVMDAKLDKVLSNECQTTLSCWLVAGAHSKHSMYILHKL